MLKICNPPRSKTDWINPSHEGRCVRDHNNTSAEGAVRARRIIVGFKIEVGFAITVHMQGVPESRLILIAENGHGRIFVKGGPTERLLRRAWAT